MKELKDKIFEDLASHVHGEEQFNDDFINDHQQDYRAVKRVFSKREQVGNVDMFMTADDAWKRLDRKISNTFRWGKIVRYAAVIVLCIATGAIGHWGLQQQTQEVAYATFVAPRGQVSSLTLYDGTKVWLNSESSIKYPSTFNQDNREITLVGEGLFEVTKNKEIPFVVNAGGSKIKVHGTTFDVKAYRNEDIVQTVLLEGKVEVINDDESVFMSPGERVQVNQQNGRITKDKVDVASYTAWKGGKVYFNKEKLKDLVVRLERWYDVRFEFTDESLKELSFSGVITRNKSLDYNLYIIKLTNKIEYKIDKDKVIISLKK
ncbi:FecR family protein [Puteibacter caeruleilacunae]|nr:FecR family protein [Puteibacter caeruleilacunae]